MGKARCQDHKQQERLSNAQSAHIQNKTMQLSVDPEPWLSGDLEPLKKKLEMLPYTCDKTTKSILSMIMVSHAKFEHDWTETYWAWNYASQMFLTKSPKLVQKCQAQQRSLSCKA